MEHDTSDQSSSDVHHGNTWRHQSLVLQSNSRDTSTLEKSMPNLQIDNNTINRINNTTTTAEDKHSRSIDDDDELINARSSPDMISDTRCAQSPSDDYSPPAPSIPLALSDEAMLPQIRFSQNTPFPLPLSTTTLSTGSSRLFDGNRNRDLYSYNNNETSPLPLSISTSTDDRLFDGRNNRNQGDVLSSTQISKESALIPSHDEEEQSMHDTLIHESISNSKCVPVEGKLADLSDNESSYSRNDEDDNEEGGIVILDESKEEDDESMHTSNRKQCIIESQAHNSQTSSMWEHDTILLDETSHINANLLSLNANNSNKNRNESLTDFEQLLNQAGDDNQALLQEIEEDIDDEQSENDRDESSTYDDNTATSGRQFWHLNPFSSSNRNKKADTINTATTPSSRHNAPIRSTRIRHDKFVIEVDITSDDNNTRLDTRDVLDLMASIELLHLWFDPVPAVFETLIKDGGSDAPDNSTSIEEDDHENNHNREYDGQWVEISTPPLTIPSDSRISGCMRAVRVGMRSLIGFPVRIKSMIFVERSCGRIGMTLGPYPDGYLCTSGTTAYHTFTIRQRDDEESNDGNRKCVVISDEVRLQRDVDSDFNGTVRSCCVCSFVRFIFGFLNVLFRWYQPDLASYMQQTISSMEKLRSLVERGESAAYSSGGEVIIDGDHDSNVGRVDETPLLGN